MAAPSVEHAHELRDQLRELAPDIERHRQVPPKVAQDLAARGLFRLLVPRSLGGGEVHPRVFVDTLEALALGDGATAWTVMTGATTGLLAAYLPRAGAEALFSSPETIPAGVFAPKGRAVPTEGGFRLTGRWPFTSGVENADLRLAGALVFDGDAPRALPGGGPEIRSFFVREAQSRVVDTWDTAGLRGTGSHDMVIEDVFVPVEHTACVLSDPPVETGPLYRFSLFGLLALGVSAVGLGIARAALDELAGLAQKKSVGRRPLAETERAQLRVASAEGELAAARAFVHAVIDEAWAAEALSDVLRARIRLAATHAARVSSEVVDAAFHLGGGAAIYARSPLQRAFRDVHTLTTHVMVAEPSLKPVGRILLGLETDVSQL